MAASGMLWPRIGFTPFLVYFPRRGPRIEHAGEGTRSRRRRAPPSRTGEVDELSAEGGVSSLVLSQPPTPHSQEPTHGVERTSTRMVAKIMKLGELHPLRDGTRHDGGGGGREHGLEDEVGPPGVGRVVEVGGVREELVGAVLRRAADREESVEVTRVVGVEAPEEVKKDAHRDDPAVLEEDVDGVFLLAEAGLEGGESEVHDEDEEGRDEDPDVVGEPRGEGIGIGPDVVVDGLVDLGRGPVEGAGNVGADGGFLAVDHGRILGAREIGDQGPHRVGVRGHEVRPFRSVAVFAGGLHSRDVLAGLGQRGVEVRDSFHGFDVGRRSIFLGTGHAGTEQGQGTGDYCE